ncbi:MAG: PAS domain S-box protein [Nitrosomonadales bacterium]
MTIINQDISAQDIEEALKNCEREAINQVGQIQSGGILLALDDAGLLISHVSQNVGAWCSYTPEELLGKPFSILVGERQAQSIRDIFNSGNWRRTAITAFDIVRNGKTLNLDAQISRSGDLWLVEIEQEEKNQDDFFHKYFIPIRDALWQLDAEEEVARYTKKVVEHIRLLTGYDRVMMYQFDDNWDGEVIAESRADEVESYLGNRFPSTDIPAQARGLYTKNLVRLVADVDDIPVCIQPAPHLQSGLPLDMTYSALRTLSPVHLQNLRNMGVRATLTISLIQNDRLWGLITCHHFTPKYIPMRERELDEFIGRTVSMKLSNLENNAKTTFHEQIRLLLEKITLQFRQNRDIGTVIEILQRELLSLIQADGAIIKLGDKRYQIGGTPNDEQENEIDNWLKMLSPQDVFQTNSLSSILPNLKIYDDIVCGLMIAPLDHTLQSYIAWFRSGIGKTVKWAGKPDKIIHKQSGQIANSPRESFSTWEETFRYKSTPWSKIEVEAANSLARAVIEVLTFHALAQNEENYRFLANNSSDMIARFDVNGIYTYLSPACENLFGYRSQEMAGKHVTEFIAPEDRDKFQDVLNSLEKLHQTDCIESISCLGKYAATSC